jgi:hypothetical protein
MNWSLIFSLSLFGMLMAIATTFLIPFEVAIFVWAVIFLVCAIIIARNIGEQYFLHGLYTGIALSVWVALIHFALFTKFIFANGWVAGTTSQLPKIASPRVMILIYQLLIGVASGVVLGLLSNAASKIFKYKEA